MSRRRPVRAWLGTPAPVDPAELLGPRGLTEEVLRGDGADDAEVAEGADEGPADAFYGSLLTGARLARIESVIAARLASVTLVLDRLLDPHNVAAALRTAEGLGLLRMHVVPHEERDLVAHRRVTQDAEKWIEVEAHGTGAQAARTLSSRGFAVYAGHLDARAVPLSQLPVDTPIALLFGNEHEGPSTETLGACAGTFRIPMGGFTQSFNVSVAAAIALSRVAEARRAFLGAAGDLDAPGRAALRSRYLRLAAKLARRIRNPPGRP
ncbi:MAG TPA: RNA methyltransferase [Myxococcales bacterium]|nr:RNA methyltransferase [Myxococcales bacterium]